MQLLMCLFCSVASYIWREHSGKQRYYLGMTEYVQVNQLYTVVTASAQPMCCLLLWCFYLWLLMRAHANII